MTDYDGARTESATERLRAMLDERGVEHEGGERSVRWRDHNGVMMQAFPLADGELGMEVWSCTPAQAIAATLGAGTCHVECFDDGIDEGLDGDPIFTPPTWYLSCGHTEQGSERPNFCPVCGKVVSA